MRALEAPLAGRRQALPPGARPAFEALEGRLLLAAAYPTAYEQYLLELVNRARANPTAEAARYGIALNEGVPPEKTISTAPKQPLAPNVYITDAAQEHSQWMLDTDTFDHTGDGGTSPKQRMENAGYVFVGWWAWGENIGWRGQQYVVPDPTVTTAELHEALFVDATVADREHRVNMMDPTFREVGMGVRTGEYTGYNAVMATEDFATSGGEYFLTGVAYDDTLVTSDDFYTPGEGLAGLTVRATRVSDGAVYNTTTWSSGGYRLALPDGTYTVTCTDAALGGTVAYGNVVMASQNVKRDFTPDDVAGDEDLTVSNVAYAAGRYFPEQRLTLTIGLANVGTAAGPFFYNARLSADLVRGNADDIDLYTGYIGGGLGAGASVSLNLTVTIPASAAAGSYFVNVTADSTDAVSESDEGNNGRWSSSANVTVARLEPYFVESQYLAMYGDVAVAVGGGAIASGYVHFVRLGMDEGRNPCVFFDGAYYLARNADVQSGVSAGSLGSAFEHYFSFGAREGRTPGPWFHEGYYRAAYGDVAAAIAGGSVHSGLAHYIRFGAAEGRSSTFNEQRYLSLYGDVRACVDAGTISSGLAHYLRWGAPEGRQTCPLIQERYYLALYADVAGAVNSGAFVSGLEHLIRFGQHEGRLAAFDEQRYLSMYPDVQAGVNGGSVASGLVHFLNWGRAEGRDACPYFIESQYLAMYPDVAGAVAAGQFASGLKHYLQYGQFEGRSPRS